MANTAYAGFSSVRYAKLAMLDKLDMPIIAGTAPAQQPSDVYNTEFLSWHHGEHSKFHGELFTRQLPFVKQCQDRCRDKTKACVRTTGVPVYHLFVSKHTGAHTVS